MLKNKVSEEKSMKEAWQCVHLKEVRHEKAGILSSKGVGNTQAEQ